MNELESKRVYVDVLIKILRGFSDRPQAIAHIRELENFSLDARDRTYSYHLRYFFALIPSMQC
jgi:hypothetical protein